MKRDRPNSAVLLELIERVEVSPVCFTICLRVGALRSILGADGGQAEQENAGGYVNDILSLNLPVTVGLRGVEMKLVISNNQGATAAPDPRLITAVAQGRRWFAELKKGDARSVRRLAARHDVDLANVSRTLPLAFLAPDIVEAILEGRQPIKLTPNRLKRMRDLPPSWAEQRRLLSFA